MKTTNKDIIDDRTNRKLINVFRRVPGSALVTEILHTWNSNFLYHIQNGTPLKRILS